MLVAARVVACSLASAAVIMLIINTLGPRGLILPRQTRVKSAVGIPVLVAVDYGTFYALHHDYPLNAALWVMAPALALFDVVYAYYLICDLRSHDGRS